MKLNKCLFIDIEGSLIHTKSGRKFPVNNVDWSFNDEVLSYIDEDYFDFICLIADRPLSTIYSIIKYRNLLKTITEAFNKIIKIPTNVMFYDVKDPFYNYPYPGGVYDLAIEYDLNLSLSTYISENETASTLSCIGLKFTKSQILLNDKE